MTDIVDGCYVEEPVLVDSLGWPANTCTEHGYVGHPPCPFRDCENGTKNDKRDVFRSLKILGMNDCDQITFGGERIFIRDSFREDGKLRWKWREVASFRE